MVTRSCRFALVGVLLLLFGSISIETQAQSAEDIEMGKRFVGMWRLASRPERLTDGRARQNPVSAAYIIYADTHPMRMCYVAMDPSRPKWKSEYSPTESEAMSAMAGSGSYCSTVEVHARERYVIHHVEIDSVPNAVRRDRKRWFTFDGPDRLSLRVDSNDLRPGIAESTLIWERVQ